MPPISLAAAEPESVPTICASMRVCSATSPTGAVALWSLHDNNRAIELAVSGPPLANDFPTPLGAAVESIGLAQVPAPIAAGLVKAGKLVQVLAPFAPMGPGVFSYPGHRQLMPKLRAFIDHVKARSNAGGKIRTRRSASAD